MIALILIGGAYNDELEKSKREAAAKKTLRPYTTSEVAKHTTLHDLWVIVEDPREADPIRKRKVYNLTPFVDEHPGGEASLLKNAGKDVTKGFFGPQHPEGVRDRVVEYHIGWVDDAADGKASKKD